MVKKTAKSPLIRIDLTASAGQELLWNILRRPDVGDVHLAPPCGTASRAREIHRKKGPSPRPLRSTRHPDGLPGLRGINRTRVQQANVLYRLTGEIVKFCILNSISVSVENPARSHFWATKAFCEPIKSVAHQLTSTFFHHCMFGSQRRKYTQLMHNSVFFKQMAIECDNNHEHLPWGFQNKGWTTAEETEYPLGLCKAYAQCFSDHLLDLGYVPPATSLLHQTMDINRVVNNQIAVDKQPKGKKIPPMVSEFAAVFTVTGPVGKLPSVGKLSHPWTVPSFVRTKGPYEISVFPKNSKIIRSKFKGDGADREEEIAIGVHWEPDVFVKIAIKSQHPRNIIQSVPSILKNTIEDITRKDDVSNARHRTEVARKWMFRALELKAEENITKNNMDQRSHHSICLETAG